MLTGLEIGPAAAENTGCQRPVVGRDHYKQAARSHKRKALSSEILRREDMLPDSDRKDEIEPLTESLGPTGAV